MEEFLAENNLRSVESEEKYRSIVTDVKIKKGTIIISSPSMGLVLMENVRNDYCHCCLGLLRKTKSRCSRCKVAHYCSRECQVKAWSSGHKYTCKLWKEKKLFDNDLMDIDLLVQVVLKICANDDEEKTSSKNIENEKKKEEVGSMAPDKLKDIKESKETHQWKEREDCINCEAFLSLMTHQDKIEFEEWKYLRDMAKAVLLIVPDLEEKTSQSELIQHLLRFKCNNFVYHDTQLFGIAESAFPVGSLFNHSCCPNATLYYHEGRQIIRAMRDIPRGEEICITYTDVMNARPQRQQILLQKYKFECQCDRCLDNNGLDQKLIPLEEEKEEEKEKDSNKTSKDQKEKEDFSYIERQLNPDLLSVHDVFDKEKCKILASQLEGNPPFASNPMLKFIVIVAAKLLSVIDASDEEFDGVHHEVVAAIDPLELKLFTKVCQYTYNCIDASDYAHASLSSLFVLMAYLVFLGRYHPLTGLQWLTFAKLIWNRSDDYHDEAVQSLYLAKTAIIIAEAIDDIVIIKS
ncbi:SET domain-containing protein [Piromyces finnis]|uniref:SET domain-containing protein n=1 Tax=Piromyces finnis TaxID=1754191 RepID=A0A1Y1UWR8_9FUNG|nr:SET domain-containing protein [Piromyces finnis]|eukprot:ORX42530.1 SET domain-containing protein [Piromyces finnis]